MAKRHLGVDHPAGLTPPSRLKFLASVERFLGAQVTQAEAVAALAGSFAEVALLGRMSRWRSRAMASTSGLERLAWVTLLDLAVVPVGGAEQDGRGRVAVGVALDVHGYDYGTRREAMLSNHVLKDCSYRHGSRAVAWAMEELLHGYGNPMDSPLDLVQSIETQGLTTEIGGNFVWNFGLGWISPRAGGASEAGSLRNLVSRGPLFQVPTAVVEN